MAEKKPVSVSRRAVERARLHVEAARRAGRSPEKITLVAVPKAAVPRPAATGPRRGAATPPPRRPRAAAAVAAAGLIVGD